MQSRPSEELVRNRARSASVCLFSLQWGRLAIMLQTSRYVELPFPNFGEGEVLVRWSIAFSFGARSQLKLLCMERTLEKDETQNEFNSCATQNLRNVEIPASDLTPQVRVLSILFVLFRIMTSRSHKDSLPGAVRERR